MEISPTNNIERKELRISNEIIEIILQRHHSDKSFLLEVFGKTLVKKKKELLELAVQFNIFWPDILGKCYNFKEDIEKLNLMEIAFILSFIIQRTNYWQSAIFQRFLQTEVSDGEGVENRSIRLNRLGLDNFQLLKVIGKGCMGKVFLARENQSGIFYAIKSIHKNWALRNKQIEHTKTERDILALLTSLQHPFLANLYCAFQTATELFLVLQYFPGGDLATQLGDKRRFSEETTKDLKPENILLRENGNDSLIKGHIVLTDFGLSKIVDERGEKTATFCGTAEYLAPEILLCLPYDYRVDLWSLGIILYEMLSGITPFWSEDLNEMYQQVVKGEFKYPPFISKHAKDLIFMLLQLRPHLRLSEHKIQAHPFFQSVNWRTLLEMEQVAPFIPELLGENDCRHFGKEFTQLNPEITPSNASPHTDNLFGGFTFVK